MTKRHEAPAAPAPLEEYAEHFDDLFSKLNQREGCASLPGRLTLTDGAQQDLDWAGQYGAVCGSPTAACARVAMVSLRIDLAGKTGARAPIAPVI
jgi:hypothetical protein